MEDRDIARLSCRLISLFNAPAVGPAAEQLTYEEETRLNVPRVRELEFLWMVSE